MAENRHHQRDRKSRVPAGAASEGAMDDGNLVPNVKKYDKGKLSNTKSQHNRNKTNKLAKSQSKHGNNEEAVEEKSDARKKGMRENSASVNDARRGTRHPSLMRRRQKEHSSQSDLNWTGVRESSASVKNERRKTRHPNSVRRRQKERSGQSDGHLTTSSHGEVKKGDSHIRKKGKSKKLPNDTIAKENATKASSSFSTVKGFRAGMCQKAEETLKSQKNTRRTSEIKHPVMRKLEDDGFLLTKQFVSSLIGMTAVETFTQLNDKRLGLERLLNNEKLDEDLLKDILHVLATCCKVSSSENLNPLLTVLKKTLFFSKHVTDYLNLIQSNDPKIAQADQVRVIDEMITIFSVYLRHMPSSYSDIPLEMVNRTVEGLQLEGNSSLRESIVALQAARDEIIKAERRRLTKPFQNCYDKKPPENFRDIQICPTVEELHSKQKPFLRKNIKKGNYEDAEHYLDVQFRLYREDFIAPLREGIQEVINKVKRTERNQNIKLYQNVSIVGKEFTRSGIVYKVRFDHTKFPFTNWKSSKRLIFGSFLCLSKDDFKTMMFATVANRDPDELKKGQFDIHFVEGQDVIGIENRKEQFVAAESPAYFEAYRHVLAGLQELTEDSLPFKQYLVQCSPDVDAPLYLRQFEEEEPVKYDLRTVFNEPSLSPLTVLTTSEWPRVETLPLNASQLEAFHSAVSKEFTIIQGPPGTGKTYVGLKIVQALLRNCHVWDRETQFPMLMVCFTNHALDQFLEGVAKFLSRGIVRVGGRCQSENLKRFNIKNFVRYNERTEGILRNMWELEDYIKKAKQFSEHPNSEILQFEQLEEIIDSRFVEQLYFHPGLLEVKTLSELFQAWLYNKFPANKILRTESNATLVQPKSEQNAETEHHGSIMEVASEIISKEIKGREQLQNHDTNIYPNVLGDKTQSYQIISNKVAENKKNESSVGNCETNFQEEEATENEVFERNEHRAKENTKNNEETIAIEQEVDIIQSNRYQEGEEDLYSPISDTEDYSSICPNDKENEKVENETIVIEQEVDIIQSHRYQEGEEDLYFPINRKDVYSSISLADKKNQNVESETIASEQEVDSIQSHKYQDGNDLYSPVTDISNSPTEESDTLFRLQKQQKKKISNSKISEADRNRVKNLLLTETNFKQEDIKEINNMWKLTQNERICLYLHWINRFREQWKWRQEQAQNTYENLCKDKAKMNFDKERDVMRNAKVVGMTTSCAAKYHSVLQQVRPKIVVIEEAAEVLEAHILTSLNENTEHVILIGDHKQLRPKPTVHQLAQKFNLEISLFERMVLNKMDCKQLCIQHRMRPEIANLTKRIYDHVISDNENVQRYPDIRGVQANLFFLDHTEPENFREGLQSYSNIHEADFVVALCRYLLQQGYQKSQITILTMYTGQILNIKEKMPRKTFEGVRLTAVDNFQGEENDIVILSLVRSNKHESIGFLNQSNRICVSLSRARMGLYVVGNFSLLCSQSSLWNDICKDLLDEGKVGSTMPLVCQKHGNVTHVKTGKDFNELKMGGCINLCEDRLRCGHVCVHQCHPTDPKHEMYRCPKKCLEKCNRGNHPCTKKCHYPRDCGECQVPEVKTFPDCGHDIETVCGSNLAQLHCLKRCERLLQCGHQCNRECSEACTLQCNVYLRKTLLCNHVKVMRCSDDPATVQCLEDCIKLLDCQHRCPGKCYENCIEQTCMEYVEKRLSCGHSVLVICSEQEKHVKCQQLCKNELFCGHNCPLKCFETCPVSSCKVKILKTLPCGHQKIMECCQSPVNAVCYEPCERKLDCGHSCSDICGKTCSRSSCSEKVSATLSCGHLQEVRCGDYPNFICKAVCGKVLCTNNHTCMKQCHTGEEPCGKCTVLIRAEIPKCNHQVEMECWQDVSQLSCPEPCTKTLACGHNCSLKCGVNCDDSTCNIKMTKTLRCGHKKDLPCFRDERDCKCYVKVKKKLLCGHEVQCACHKKTEDIECNKKVIIHLKTCGHSKTVPCFLRKKIDDGKMDGLCNEVVQRVLPCGHAMKLACSQDVSKVFCKAKCERTLPCGHHCQMKCGDDCRKTLCKMKCTKMLKCGHQCFSLCGEKCRSDCKEKCRRVLPCNHPCQRLCCEPCDASTCTIRVKKPFPCGHVVKKGLPCRVFKNATCRVNCQRKLRCGHNCPGTCGTPCSQYKCRVGIMKKFPCGHSLTVECSRSSEIKECISPCATKLDCGHLCRGVCGTCQKAGTHEKCNLPCGRTLVCQHRCPAPCSEPCPPCTRECRVSCVHKMCDRHCSEECEPCRLPCASSCPHFQCNNLCHEICNRPLCNEPCRKNLRCGHPCIGLCGEICPSICRVCNSKQLAAINQGRTYSSKTRFIQLFNCGHVFEVSFLDKWMSSDSHDLSYKQIDLKCCPQCSVPVFFSFRYSHSASSTKKNLHAIKMDKAEISKIYGAAGFKPVWRFQDLLFDSQRRNFKGKRVKSQLFFKSNIELLELINRTINTLKQVNRTRTLFTSREPTKAPSKEIRNRLQQLLKLCTEMEYNLMTLQPDVTQIVKISQVAIIVCVLVDVLEIKVEESKTFTPIVEDILNEILNATGVQGASHEHLPLVRLLSILSRWKLIKPRLEDKLSQLTNEVGLTGKQYPIVKLVTFPGYCKEMWFNCHRGHVFSRRQTTTVSAFQEPAVTTVIECLECKTIDSTDETNEEGFHSSLDEDVSETGLQFW